jgi:Ca2+-binding EF-hand superfamily protein
MRSFVVASYEPKEEPADFTDLARESMESLDRENLKSLVKAFEKKVKTKPQMLDDIWIKGGEEGEEGIDRNQFFQLCNMIGEPITQAELDEMLREADFDGDGNIDAEEFRRIVSYFV